MLKTIKSKITFIVLLLLSIIIFIGLNSLVKLKTVNEKSTIISQQMIPGIIYSEELNTLTSDFRILEYEHVIAENKETMSAKEKAMEEKNKEIQEFIKKYENTATAEKDKKLINDVKDKWSHYLDLNKKAAVLSNQLKTEEAMKILNTESKEAFDSASSTLLKLAQLNKQASENASLEGDRQYENPKNSL